MVHLSVPRDEDLRVLSVVVAALALGFGLGVLWAGAQLTTALQTLAPFEPSWYDPLRREFEVMALVGLGGFAVSGLGAAWLQIRGGDDE